MQGSIQQSGIFREPQNVEQETLNNEGRYEEKIPVDILHSLFDIRSLSTLYDRQKKESSC